MSRVFTPRVILGLAAVVALAVTVGAILLMTRYEGRIAAFGGQDAAAHLNFDLIDHTGAPARDEDFRGRWVLAYYGYTFCPDICPGSLATMATALDALGPAGDAITPIFVTVDPERDTVDAMAAYVELFHPRLIGLTGPQAQTDAAAQAARARYERVDDPSATYYLIDHTSELHLFDPEGLEVDRISHGVTGDEIARRLQIALSR